MNDQQVRALILETAYKVWKEKESIQAAAFCLFEKTKDWGEEEKDINRNLRYLDQKGDVKMEWYKSGCPFIRITLQGVEKYEGEHGQTK